MPSRTRRRKVGVRQTRTMRVSDPRLHGSIGLRPIESRTLKFRSNNAMKHKLVHEVMAQFAPHSIRPVDDFYDYINYQWLKNVSVTDQQQYIVQVDDFRLAQDKVYHQLSALVDAYIREHKHTSVGRNLATFRRSLKRRCSPARSKEVAQNIVQRLDALREESGPWALLAYLHENEMVAPYAPFTWTVSPDEANNQECRCYVGSGQYNLVDIDVYFDDGVDVAYKARYRRAFERFVRDVFDVALGAGHGLDARDVFRVEQQLLEALGCDRVVKGEEARRNRVSADEALSTYGFDWPAFAAALGYARPPAFFLTGSLNYLRCGSDLLRREWRSPAWRTYFLFVLLKSVVRLTRGWEHLTFGFRGKFERGQAQIVVSDAVRDALYLSLPFNALLTREYVKHYEDARVMEYARVLCEDLRTVFRRMLARNQWLSPRTREYALKKLDACVFVYGHPDRLLEDPALEYGPDLFDNMQRVFAWRKAWFLTREGLPPVDVPMVDWVSYPAKLAGDQAYIVNASYTPTKNRIYINLGYLQEPFVDLHERGIEYNLAHLGFTIAHELGHGFDDWGSQYGADGNLYDWWTPTDRKRYKAIQHDVVRQYTTFAQRDGIEFDAEIGIGEDLADIQSLAVCDEYLRDFQMRNGDIVPIKALGFQAFYTYFAFQQRQFVGKRALAAQLKTNPHPLDKYRCNVPLSRSEMFRAIYNVRPRDGMWWHNTNTVW